MPWHLTRRGLTAQLVSLLKSLRLNKMYLKTFFEEWFRVWRVHWWSWSDPHGLEHIFRENVTTKKGSNRAGEFQLECVHVWGVQVELDLKMDSLAFLAKGESDQYSLMWQTMMLSCFRKTFNFLPTEMMGSQMMRKFGILMIEEAVSQLSCLY